MRDFNRRLMLAAAAALMLASCKMGGAGAGGPAMDDDMSMGDAKAKVQMTEYASAACPHCAAFAIDVFPAFKAKYIDTGKVHYTFREILTAPQQVAAAGFLLARCSGKDKYFATLDGVFRSQQDWVQTGDVRGALLRVAQNAGISEEKFNACINDEKAIKALNARVQKYAEQDKIDGTPTFLIDGKKLEGEQSLDTLSKAVDAALAAKK
jgi:protein-disulfide isomerase